MVIGEKTRLVMRDEREVEKCGEAFATGGRSSCADTVRVDGLLRNSCCSTVVCFMMVCYFCNGGVKQECCKGLFLQKVPRLLP